MKGILIDGDKSISRDWRGGLLDLSGDERIVSTFAINNLQDIYSRQGVYSNIFEIPMTAHNVRLLEYAQNINTPFRKPYKKIDCRIIEYTGNEPDNGLTLSGSGLGTTLIYGTMQIVAATDIFRVKFTSGNTDFFLLLKESNLNDLDLSPLNHTYTLANVLATANNTWANGYCYPVIDYGKLENAGEVIEFTELYIAVFAKYIMLEIIKRNGYSVKGSFVTNKVFEEQLLITNVPVGYPDKFIKATSFKAILRPSQNIAFNHTNVVGSSPKLFPVVFNNDSTTPVSYDGDNNSYDTVTGKYTAKDYGYYNISVNIKVDVSVVVGRCSARIYLQKNGVEISRVAKTFRAGLQPRNYPDSPVTMNANGIYLQPADALSIFFEILDDSGIFSYSGTINLDDDSYFQVELLPNFPESAALEVSQFLPAITQTDFFLTLANQFNLLFSTDTKNKIIYIETFNIVADNVGKKKYVDWTSKVDYASLPELDFYQQGYGQQSLFAYSEDSEDELLKKDAQYGNSNLLIDNELLPKQETVFNAVFAATKEKQVQRKTRALLHVPIYKPKDKVNYGVWSDQITYFFDPVKDYVEMRGRFFVAIVNNISGDNPPLNDAGQLQFGEWAEVSRKDIFDLFDTNSLSPRLVLRNRLDLKATRLLTPGTNESTDYICNVSFEPLTFENLIKIYYRALSDAFYNAKFLRCAVRLNSIDIAKLDFFTPVFIASEHVEFADRFNAFFYLSQVYQHEIGESSSTLVDLIKILPAASAVIDDSNPPEELIAGLLQENLFSILQENGRLMWIEEANIEKLLQEGLFDIETEDNTDILLN